MKATVLGANGYAGMLLLRILARHPDITRITASSRSLAGRSLDEADPGLSTEHIGGGRFVPTVLAPEEALKDPGDVVFSALPHGASATVCAPILGAVPLIDLSADFRFDDLNRFREAYGSEAPVTEAQGSAVYGLSEWYRAKIPGSSIIANPGCYPTATLLPLLPIARAGLITGTVVVNALSGISGAGRTEKRNLLFSERTENANAYSVGTRHRHGAEIAEKLDLAGAMRHTVIFNPHLVPIKQGMAVTTVVPTDAPQRAVEALRSAWDGEPFIECTGETPPESRHVRGTNRIRIGWREEEGYLILMSVIDNLWKGASGQAIQNMNILFSLPETSGLAYGTEL